MFHFVGEKIYAKELTREELQKYEFLLQGEEVLMALKVQIGRDIFIATNKKLLFIDKNNSIIEKF